MAGKTKTATRRGAPARKPAKRTRKPLEPGTLEHFEAFCRRLTLDNGRRFRLQAFQRLVLADYFAGCFETVVLLPKGNGKTTLFAALALYHLIHTPDAECFIAAASMGQASLMYNHAKGFCERKDADGQLTAGGAWLQERVVVKKGTKEVRSLVDNGFVRVLASDSDTADGVGPTLALVDELHRHKTDELYGVFRDGLGKRGGQIITISTAGEDELSPLGKIRTRAHELPDLKKNGGYLVARARNGEFVLHEWALTPLEDRQDLRVVKRANPASFVTLAKLRTRRDSPTMTPWAWARFACNIWSQVANPAIDPLLWARASRARARIPDGAGIYVGLDMARVWDTTAIVPLWPRDDGPWVTAHARVLKPPGDGTAMKVRPVVDELLAMRERWDIRELVFDPNAAGGLLAEELRDDHGFTIAEHSQDAAPMALAAERLLTALSEGALVHDENPTVTSHVLAAVAKTVAGERWRLEKARRPIDAAIALAMALSVARSTDEEEPSDRPAVEVW